MKKTIGFGEFCDSFSDTYRGNFSYKGKRALFDYLEEYEGSTGEEVELDIVALCCDYTEYADLAEIQADYPKIKNMDYLTDHTTVIEFDGGIIIRKF